MRHISAEDWEFVFWGVQRAPAFTQEQRERQDRCLSYLHHQKTLANAVAVLAAPTTPCQCCMLYCRPGCRCNRAEAAERNFGNQRTEAP